MNVQRTAYSEKQRVSVMLNTGRWPFATAPVRALRAMTLIDVVVGTALMLTVFLSLFAAFKLSIELVHGTKAKAGAIALMTEQMEYVRGLPYEDVGTVGGIPAGPIEQQISRELNGIQYTVRTLIQYMDAPEDGLDAADTNGITADYKSVKVAALWSVRGNARSTFSVTRISPHGVESLTNGGTLRVNVFNANTEPVQGANVSIVNVVTNPVVSLSILTDDAGTVLLPGAPAAAGYEISATKNGYSASQTYDATADNPSPNPGHAAVANQLTTTLSLAIDVFGTLRVTTFDPIGEGSFDDSFLDDSLVSATSSVTASGGVLIFDGVPSAYPPLGFARSIDIEPAYLSQWINASWTASSSASASITMRVYAWDGAQYALISDDDLLGNSSGFESSPIDLSTVSASAYPSLALGATFATTDPLETPELEDWRVRYNAGPTPKPNIDFSLRGSKAIGSDAMGVPIYKVDADETTGSDGQWYSSVIEWDYYTVSLSGTPFDVVEQCPFEVPVAPAENKEVTVIVTPHTTNSLHLYITGTGQPLFGGNVTIVGNALNEALTSSECGQAFVGGIVADTYTVTVNASGYLPYTEDVAVNGRTLHTIVLVPN